MAGSPPIDEAASDGAAAESAVTLAQLQATIASLSQAVTASTGSFGEGFGKLTARIDALEIGSRAASEAGRHSGESDASGESTEGQSVFSDSDESAAGAEYLQVNAETNRHWKAAERALDADQRPRRYSLYGFEPFDNLRAGRHQGGGTLGTVMRYAEPSALYLQTAIEGVRSCRAACDPGDPMCADLDAVLNTLMGVYALVNTLRTLVCERAAVLGPGATAADKKRQQWVEAQLDDDDFAPADVAPKIRKLKAIYDHEAGRADLRHAAKGGKASGSFTDGAGSDGEPSRSRRRREQRRRTAGSGTEGTRTDRQPRRDRGDRREERPERRQGQARHSSRAAQDGQEERDRRPARQARDTRRADPASGKRRDADRPRGRDEHATPRRDGGSRKPRDGGRDGRPARSEGRRLRRPDFASGSERSGNESGDSF